MELISINALWINDWIFLRFAPQDSNIPFNVDSWAQKVTNYSVLMVWGLMKSPTKVCLSLPTADITNQIEPSFPWTKCFGPYSLSHWERECCYRILIRDQHCGSRGRKQDQTEVEMACVTGLIKSQGSCKLWSIGPSEVFHYQPKWLDLHILTTINHALARAWPWLEWFSAAEADSAAARCWKLSVDCSPSSWVPKFFPWRVIWMVHLMSSTPSGDIGFLCMVL